MSVTPLIDMGVVCRFFRHAAGGDHDFFQAARLIGGCGSGESGPLNPANVSMASPIREIRPGAKRFECNRMTYPLSCKVVERWNFSAATAPPVGGRSQLSFVIKYYLILIILSKNVVGRLEL